MLKESETKNAALVLEVKHLQKIQLEQGRALEKISDEHDYPMRINAMLEELRCEKGRCRKLSERLR
jgi:hypothetical protein